MKKAKIFFITDFGDAYKEVTNIVHRALHELKLRKGIETDLLTVETLPLDNVAGNVLRLIQEADLVISNVSQTSGTTMYELVSRPKSF